MSILKPFLSKRLELLSIL